MITVAKRFENITSSNNWMVAAPAAGGLAALGTIDLGEGDRGVVGKKSGGRLLEFGLQTLAVAAPEQGEMGEFLRKSMRGNLCIRQ